MTSPTTSTSSRRSERPPTVVEHSVGRLPADAVVDHGHRSTEAVELRQVMRDVTAEWADLIRQAAADGYALADIARPAGVTAPSLYYWLRRPVLEDSLHRPQCARGDRGGVGDPSRSVRGSWDPGARLSASYGCEEP